MSSTHTVTTTVVLDPESSLPSSPDPFFLSSAIKSPAEIDDIGKQNKRSVVSRLPFTSRKGDTTTPSSSSTKKRQKVDVKGVQEFYESQNAHIQKLLKSVDDHKQEAKDEHGDNRVR